MNEAGGDPRLVEKEPQEALVLGEVREDPLHHHPAWGTGDPGQEDLAHTPRPHPLQQLEFPE